MPPQISPDDLIDKYCYGWSASDPNEREAVLTSIWAEGAIYIDPRVHVTGVVELLNYIKCVQTKRPGSQVLRTSRVDVHHQIGRFTWHVQLSDGSTLPEGIDFVELSSDGQKIERVLGFFGPL